MWLWQQRLLLPKKYTFLTKLFLISCCLHLGLLFVGLFIMKGERFSRQLNLNAGSLTVMFLPFQKRVAQAQVASTSGEQASGNLHVITAQKNTVVAQQSTQPSTSKKPTTQLVTKMVEKPKSKKQELNKKVKQQEKKKLEKKVVEEKEKKIKEEPKKVIEQEEGTQQEAVSQALVGGEQTEGVIFAGQDDLDVLELSAAIAHEIEDMWKPPVGLKPERCCKVRVLVGWNGQSQEIHIEESSNIVVFDMSVRNALMKMNFPKSTYGKELILPFS